MSEVFPTITFAIKEHKALPYFKISLKPDTKLVIKYAT